jgi:hypothetical protein
MCLSENASSYALMRATFKSIYIELHRPLRRHLVAVVLFLDLINILSAGFGSLRVENGL